MNTKSPFAPYRLTGTVRLCAFALITLLAFAGCGVPGKHGQIMTVSTWIVGAKVSSVNSTTGTPEVWMGVGRQTVTYMPTSTNGPIYAPRYAASYHSTQTAWNPLSADAVENVMAGDVMIGTNSESSAILPKSGPPESFWQSSPAASPRAPTRTR